MKHSVPLIDENFMFVEDVQEYLQDNSSDFLVVGIIGNQGVGKSTIMNMLIDDNIHKISDYKERERSGSTSDGSKTNDIELNLKNLSENFSNLNVQHKGSSELLNCGSDEAFFKVQSIHELERGIHCTVGLNAYVTPNRVSSYYILKAGPLNSYWPKIFRISSIINVKISKEIFPEPA